LNNISVDNDWLAIGKIVAPQGLNGEVRIYPDTDFPERFLTPGQRWLRSPQQSQPIAIELEQGRYLEAKNLYVVRFQGICDRNQAEALRGCTVLVRAGDRPKLEPGEYYLTDLIGLEVLDVNSQKLLGHVIQLASAGNDLLEIELLDPQGTRVLVPFVAEFFPTVDLLAKRLELRPLPGLLP
jgi:16S rRNA processing protein RimM